MLSNQNLISFLTQKIAVKCGEIIQNMLRRSLSTRILFVDENAMLVIMHQVEIDIGIQMTLLSRGSKCRPTVHIGPTSKTLITSGC